MKVTLTLNFTTTTPASVGVNGLEQTSTVVLHGTPDEIQGTIDELFSAEQATALRHQTGLKVISASDSSGRP